MKIEFVSYTGSWPNLCSGTLTLRIDGEEIGFSGYGGKYHRFWSPGGSVWFGSNWGEHVDQDKWVINEEDLPEELRPYVEEIAELFNDNVPYGCCGGCV